MLEAVNRLSEKRRAALRVTSHHPSPRRIALEHFTRVLALLRSFEGSALRIGCESAAGLLADVLHLHVHADAFHGGSLLRVVTRDLEVVLRADAGEHPRDFRQGDALPGAAVAAQGEEQVVLRCVVILRGLPSRWLELVRVLHVESGEQGRWEDDCRSLRDDEGGVVQEEVLPRDPGPDHVVDGMQSHALAHDVLEHLMSQRHVVAVQCLAHLLKLAVVVHDLVDDP
mmetsp:Transcript_20375/g.56706  ORF Transcript_20375/g.56706 Transcript_20375/m.56706 type:complete len:227 (-) Transcript_20375:196-876(-)